VDGGNAGTHRVCLLSDGIRSWFRIPPFDIRPVADSAPGTEDRPAVDHISVPPNRFDQGAPIKASGHGAGPSAVCVDEQRLGTTHPIKVPVDEGTIQGF
jgi:hypothetical protein